MRCTGVCDGIYLLRTLGLACRNSISIIKLSLAVADLDSLRTWVVVTSSGFIVPYLPRRDPSCALWGRHERGLTLVPQYLTPELWQWLPQHGEVFSTGVKRALASDQTNMDGRVSPVIEEEDTCCPRVQPKNQGGLDWPSLHRLGSATHRRERQREKQKLQEESGHSLTSQHTRVTSLTKSLTCSAPSSMGPSVVPWP